MSVGRQPLYLEVDPLHVDLPAWPDISRGAFGACGCLRRDRRMAAAESQNLRCTVDHPAEPARLPDLGCGSAHATASRRAPMRTRSFWIAFERICEIRDSVS